MSQIFGLNLSKNKKIFRSLFQNEPKNIILMGMREHLINKKEKNVLDDTFYKG